MKFTVLETILIPEKLIRSIDKFDLIIINNFQNINENLILSSKYFETIVIRRETENNNLCSQWNVEVYADWMKTVNRKNWIDDKN